MANGITMSGAASANIQILQIANENFQITQKRVSTGKMVFGAADDTTRYTMSETMLTRNRQITDINNNISLALKTLEATDRSMKQMIGLIEAGQNLIRKAQAEGAAGVRGVTSTANINSGTFVGAPGALGDRISITSDSGQNFTFVFPVTGTATTGTTWGDIANALNAANIGVQLEFVPSATAGQTNPRFVSTNGKDFTFDNTSDDGVMALITGLTSPGTNQTYSAPNLFATGAGAPGANESGFTVAYGGSIIGNKAGGVTAAGAIAAGATLVYEDGNGQTRTWVAGGADTVATFMASINSLGAGVKAELVNQTGAGAGPLQLRLRNTNGGNMKILAGTNEFAAAGALGFAASPTTGFQAPLSTNNTLRLSYGVQYNAVITNINNIIVNNPVQNGRNLLTGQGMNVVMDEFAGNPITISGINLTGSAAAANPPTNTALGFTAANGGTTWVTDAAIQVTATAANNALVALRDFQARFATFNTYMKERYDLNKSYASDLKATGDEIVAADMAEESANMTALQTRQQFAVQAFSLGSQTEQGLLRLLG